MTRSLEARLTHLERRTDASADVAVVIYQPGAAPEPDEAARAVVYIPDNGRDCIEEGTDAHDA